MNYIVWHPSTDSDAPLTVRAFVTLARAARIAEGTADFATACLAAAGVELRGPVVGWELRRYRACYFTEYPDSDEAWDDRWQVVWRLRVALVEPPVLRGDSIDGQYPCDAEDASWTEAALPRAAAARCLLLADFPTAAARDEARAVLAGAVEETRAGSAMGVFHQLELDLGAREAGFYDGGDGPARDLVARCHELGATTHYQRSVVAKLRR